LPSTVIMDSISRQSLNNGAWAGTAASCPPPLLLPAIISPRPQAGFPSPATDYVEDSIDLNQLLIDNPPATFFVRIQGDSLQELSILQDDIAAVDRSLNPKKGDVVVAVFQGDMYIKVLENRAGRLALCSRHASLELYPPMFLDQDEDAIIWGVVTGIVRGVGKKL
jgi:DNA polymerase V